MEKLADISKFESLLNGSFWDTGRGQVIKMLGQGAMSLSVPAIALGSLAAGNLKRRQMQNRPQPVNVERTVEPEDVPMDPSRFLVRDVSANSVDGISGESGRVPLSEKSGSGFLRNASLSRKFC